MPAAERYRHPSFWTGRTIRALIVTLMLLTALRWGWGRMASSRIEAQWEASRKKGQPTTAADIKATQVADEANAWRYQEKAYESLIPGVDCYRSGMLEATNYPPYGPKWIQLVEGSESVHGKVFALARQARAYPLARIYDRFELSVLLDEFAFMSKSFNKFSHARQLTSFLGDGAQLMEIRGRHAEAVERVRDILHVARSLRQDVYSLSVYVAIGVDARACETAQIIAPGLALSSSDPGAAETRASVKGLIADLLDESTLPESMRRALYVDRLLLTPQVSAGAAGRWAIRPLADATLLRGLERVDLTIAASSASDSRSAAAILAGHWMDRDHDSAPRIGLPIDLEEAKLLRYSSWFEWLKRDAFAHDRVIERSFRSISDRRMTAVILAAQLFRADHNRWPHSLDELAPAYLPAVPRDPFQTGGAPIGYVILRKALPDGGDRPLVYCEHASADDEDYAHWRSPLYGWQEGTVNGRRSREVRQYRDLARFRFPDVPIKEDGQVVPVPGGGFSAPPAPEPTPSTEGVEDQPDKPGTPGEDKNKQPIPN